MEPNGAFVIGLFASGSFGIERWGKWLGDASSFNWPNCAFKASEMDGGTGALFS